MHLSLSKSYRYARWPLVKNTTVCVFWILIGVGVLIAPLGQGRWLGLLPIGYGLTRFIFSLRPKWKHVVILDEGKLKVGKRSYDWNQFDLMQIGKNDSMRIIHLIGQEGNLNIEFKDDLSDFDELAQNCFFHMNRKVGQPNSLNSSPESGSPFLDSNKQKTN